MHDLSNKIQISDGYVYEGMIHLGKDTKISIKDLYFLRNHAYHRATIYVKEQASFNIITSVFTENSATDDSAVLYIDGLV